MPGLLRGVARTAVVAGTATAVSNRVSRRQSQRWSQQDYQSQQEYQQQPVADDLPATAPSSSDDMDAKLAQLKTLGELKAQGVLTEAEFETQKSRLLNS
jgi:hypothetical protein